jgi:hypothetical protein
MSKPFAKLRINSRKFAHEASKVRSAKKAKDLAYKKAQKLAKQAKDEMLIEFEQNRITKELEAGPGNMKNLSRNLLGLPYGQGSLYGFIGFVDGANPIEPVREYLQNTGNVFKTSRFQRRGKTGGTYQFKVKTPLMSVIEGFTPMPWEGGKSWARAIERGISGLSYYIANKSPVSRSGQGIQSKNQFHQAAMYKPSKYLSNIINNYIRRIQGRAIQK